MAPVKFEGKLWSPHPEMGGWTFLNVPKDASKTLGAKGTVKVEGTINGFRFRTSAQPDGKGSHVIAVNKAMRDGAKATLGDTVQVVLAPAQADKAPKLPADLAKRLKASAKASAQWQDITPRAKQEWIGWVEDAKKEETRLRRLDAVVKRLAAGERRVYD